MTQKKLSADELATVVAREERRDRFWFAVQLTGLWILAATVLGWKELQHGIQALPIYIAEMLFFTVLALIAWHRTK